MSSLKEKMSVVMLATTQKSNIQLGLNLNVNIPGQLRGTYFDLHIISNKEIKEGDWFLITNAIGGQNIRQCGNIEPKYIVTKGNTGIFKEVCKKIEASTDKSFNLPRPSNQFVEAYIKAYNAGNPITEVMVDMNEPVCKCDTVEKLSKCPFACNGGDECNAPNPNNDFYGLKVKTAPDGTITISRVEETITADIICKVIKIEENLYITSDKGIKESDWVYNPFNKDITQVKRMDWLEGYKGKLQKIIATTDSELWKDKLVNNGLGNMPENYKRIKGVAKIPIDFLEVFCKTTPQIEKVLVEYEGENEDLQRSLIGIQPLRRPKVAPDNTITISKMEETWEDIHDTLLDEGIERIDQIFLYLKKYYNPPKKK